MIKSEPGIQKDYVGNSDLHVYSRKSNYRGLLDTDECCTNQIDVFNNEHHPYAENVQINATNKLKYNKRIKTLIENERNGNYVPQSYVHENKEEIAQPHVQIGQQNTQHEQHFEQNMVYALPRNECDQTLSNKKDLKNEMNSQPTYTHMILPDNTNINSNIETFDVSQTNVNHHFNDHLQPQTISRAYNPHCGKKLNDNGNTLISTYQSLPNDTLNSTMHQQCEQSFGRSYQKHECE